MKQFTAGLVLALAAAGALAQQAPRPQLQQKATKAGEAVEEMMSTRSVPPLSSQQKQQAYTKALGVAKIDTGELGAPVRITPRDLYVNSTTYAWVRRGTVASSMGPTGTSRIFARPAGSGDQPMLEIYFRAAASKQYIVDCAMPTAPAPIKAGFSGPEIRVADGHWVHAVPGSAQARDVKLQLMSDGPFEWTLCEIVPINR